MLQRDGADGGRGEIRLDQHAGEVRQGAERPGPGIAGAIGDAGAARQQAAQGDAVLGHGLRLDHQAEG